MSTWHREMTVDFFSDEASSFRVSEIFVPALGVRQENFIICLFDVFSQVIGLNSVYFNSRKVTFRRVHNRGSQIPPSRLYFLLYPAIPPFLRTNPDPTLIFSRLSCLNIEMDVM